MLKYNIILREKITAISNYITANIRNLFRHETFPSINLSRIIQFLLFPISLSERTGSLISFTQLRGKALKEHRKYNYWFKGATVKKQIFQKYNCPTEYPIMHGIINLSLCWKVKAIKRIKRWREVGIFFSRFVTRS